MATITRILTLFLFILITVVAPTQTLLATKAPAAPTLDGSDSDAVWTSASPMIVSLDSTPYRPNNGYPGIAKTNVVMKATYVGSKIYFLIQWDDPTKSLERFPWVKQTDGSWLQKKNLDSTGHENTFYEDKFAILWDINTPGFASAGCAITCHLNVDAKSAGRKYTSSPGQTIDMWHWKSVRTGPVRQIDDQYIDDNTDPAKNSGWGRWGDTKTGGGYANNIDNGRIKWQDARTGSVQNNQYWILDSGKKPFVDTFKSGDKVAGIVVAPFTGPRGDIDAVAEWAAGRWTLEISRELVTTGENSQIHDVQFGDVTKTYPFGIAVFDNSQINHVFHWGVLKLEFQR